MDTFIMIAGLALVIYLGFKLGIKTGSFLRKQVRSKRLKVVVTVLLVLLGCIAILLSCDINIYIFVDIYAWSAAFTLWKNEEG